ncbi:MULTISPECIES: sensor histidine kinase [Bacillus]|uniref:histidine kinase n=1 Tax=Bacillus mycoides TaxID=1405 RepID=A0A1D3ML84_BACMY|nr:histidine kinase [Bacillus mycoides]MBJ8070395.1 sensor histidine kinase [Bacillus cereus]MBJ8186588.1 sensor histidine kinase [Bacillus cereus]OFD44478.1 two-component sensor histidine kinase [Bacillus mycoides]OFD47312.1 two-component sensor histidine kinase [Bacillus mycoides]OFD96461.1 two-component sensor histidine kinase [Bacillus mycoides]
MEFWLTVSKLIVFIYIVFSYIHSNVGNLSWVIFTLLIYLSVNVMISILRKDTYKKIFICVSIGVVMLFTWKVHPFFILFLPLNLYEITFHYIEKNWPRFVIMMLPITITDESIRMTYGLIAAFSFLVLTMADRYISRVLKLESQNDKMRKDMQRLTKSLNENKEYIRQSEYTFKLEERNRLSQEIHDKIGHSMTGALIQMEAAKRLMEIDKVKSAELLQNAIHISKDGIESIRITLKNMKPPTEQIGIHRMKLFIEEFAGKHDVNIPFIYKGNLDMISPIQWKIIGENVTEALTNTMKYADATVISIDIHVLNKMIKVQVKDNGKGADLVKKGLGIMGMEERTASVNGKIIVDGTSGFSVTMLLPI